MGNNKFTLILISVVFILTGCGNNTNIKKGTENLLPRLILNEGDKYNVTMELIQAISLMEDGKEQVIDQSVTMKFLIAVDSTFESGYYALKADVNEVSITRNIPLKETIEISSKNLKNKDLDSQYVKVVKSLMDKRILLEVDQRGIIKNRKIKSKSNPDSILSSDLLLPRVFEEHVSTKQNLELFFPYYPEDSVVVNQLWSHETLMKNSVSMLAKSSLMIDSFYADTISMSITTELIQQRADNISKSDAQKSRSGKQTKESLIDRNSGWPTTVEILSEVKVMEKIGLKILRTTTTTINFDSKKLN